jgi:hypothetical protein
MEKSFAICHSTSNISIRLSVDDGFTWNEVYSAQHLNNYYAGGGMVFMDSNVVVAVISFTMGPTIGDVGAEFLRSTDGGLNWQLLGIANAWGGAEDLVKLQDGRILVTTTLSGVSVSEDNGSTWYPLTSFPPYFTNYIETNSSGDIFLTRNTAASQSDLVYRSTDNGNSWQGVGLLSGMNGGNVNALYIDNADNIYISLYTSSPIYKTIYRSSNNGSSWQEIKGGLPSTEIINSLTGNSEDIIFAGTQNSGVYKGWMIVPVELTLFTANLINNSVLLNWQTGTETNNKGFEIQRNTSGKEFEIVGFIAGYGTTSEPVNYEFTDSDISQGKYVYRLKQIDFDGNFEYSNGVEVDVLFNNNFYLGQNYPNPFNPETKINYTIPSGLDKSQLVTLKIFDILGSEVAVLVNEEISAGNYEVIWNAADIPAGVYFYTIRTGGLVETKKMILLK